MSVLDNTSPQNKIVNSTFDQTTFSYVFFDAESKFGKKNRFLAKQLARKLFS